eukprot:6069965-Ditylum_brightwellii.AAC.1
METDEIWWERKDIPTSEKFNNEFKFKKEVGLPGFITKVHPKLANLNTLKYNITEALKAANCDNEKMVEKLKDIYQNVEEEKNTIPNFLLLVQNRRWGQPPSRVEATVIVIQCAAKDASYMKTLLSTACNKGIMDAGVFVPQGVYRIVGKEMYKQKLHEHNKYFTNITTVANKVMHKNAVWSDIKIN